MKMLRSSSKQPQVLFFDRCKHWLEPNIHVRLCFSFYFYVLLDLGILGWISLDDKRVKFQAGN